MPMFSFYLVFKMWLTELLILIFHSTVGIIHLQTCHGFMMADCISSSLDLGLDQIVLVNLMLMGVKETEAPSALMCLDCILELFHYEKIVFSVLSKYFSLINVMNISSNITFKNLHIYYFMFSYSTRNLVFVWR